MREPEDKTQRVSFLRGDDYATIRPPLREYKGSVSRRGYHSSMCDLLKFKHPFTCIVAGPTCSVKTSFCIKLLRNLDTQCTESRFGGGIIWCYSEETAVPRQQLDRLGLNITYQEGLPREIRQRPRRTVSHNLGRSVESSLFERRLRSVHEGQSPQKYQRVTSHSKSIPSGY